MKRLAPLALIVPLALAGCSSSNKTASSPTTTPATAAPSTSATTASGPTTAQTITEAGSSLLYPYLQTIAPGLHTTYPNVTLSPAAGGSGAGITDAIHGTTDLGGSDAYLSPSEFSSNPGLMNIPIVVSSQAVDYNVKGTSNLKLSGDVLAKIYQGSITKWNDPAIAALNPGVTLPSEAIVPVRRSDSSGDTFLFTTFLSDSNSTWASSISYNTTVNWPSVGPEKTAQGNSGMVDSCSTTPGCVAYIGISSQAKAVKAGLQEAELQNKSGMFVTDTSSSVNAAVAAGSGSIPTNLAVSLVDEPGDGTYPIVNFEYIVVKSSQSNSDMAAAIRAFLSYATSTTGGSSAADLAADQFEALPSSVLSSVQSAISSIQ